MPDTNWDRYVIKPPKPTFSEKIKEIGKNVNEWKRHKHYRRHGLKLKDVAAELGTNSAYLSFYIRKAGDTTFVPWLNNLRIEEAKRLMLSHPEMSIYDIGYKVGQPHPASFKQAFVKITGQTPDEWKIENVEINKDND